MNDKDLLHKLIRKKLIEFDYWEHIGHCKITTDDIKKMSDEVWKKYNITMRRDKIMKLLKNEN